MGRSASLEEKTEVVGADGVERATYLRRGGASGQRADMVGSLLVERIGRARLLALEGARESESGVIRIDLLPEPWTASLLDLVQRKQEVMQHLRPSGMFRDVEIDEDGKCTKTDPAPKWTPPDWTLS
jgi:hypothetical protein